MAEPGATADAKLLATEFDRLPAALQASFIAQPVQVQAVLPEGERFRLADPHCADRPAELALFPKLGIKSWRDSGSLGIVYAGAPVARLLSGLLAKPTRAQRLAASAWTENDEPLQLYLFPYLDFSDISEVRFLVGGGACERLSSCLRGASAAAVEEALPALAELAQQVAGQLPPVRHIVDLALLPSGARRVVDVNPGLTPVELRWLDARLAG